MTRRAIFLLLLLSLALTSYAVPISTLLQPKKTILSSSGIILCSRVEGYGKFTPKENLVIKAGERVYFYNQIELKATKVNNTYKVHVTWVLTIYDPFGRLDYNSSTSTGLRSASEERVKWCAWFFWRSSKSTLEGKYKVVLKIIDELSGDSLVHEINFDIVGGLPKTLRYDVNITITLHNKLRKSATVTKLFIVTIPTKEPYQRITWGPEFSIEPSSYITDPYGNRYAVFENLKIPSGVNLTIVIRYVIMVYVTFYKWIDVTLEDLKNLSPDLLQYTRPEEYIESDAEEIVEEANRIASKTNNVYELCALIANFTSNYVKYTLGINYDKGALWVYKNRKGKCGHFARLYVALARALGIPAKTAYGLGFLSIEFGKIHIEDSTHSWVLVYIPGHGWVPVEPQHGYNEFGLAPYYHILMASNWYRQVEVNGYRFRVKAYACFSEGDISISMVTRYKVTPVRKSKKTLTMRITYFDTKVYAGGVAEVKGRLSVPLNTVLYITTISPSGAVYSDVIKVVKGEFSLKVRVPTRRESLGKWRVRLIWLGDEEYNPVDEEIEFLVTSKKSKIELNVPTEVVEGHELIIKGRLNPPLASELIQITLLSPNGATYGYNVTTTANGEFLLAVNTWGKPLGTWIIKAMWSGGERDYLYDPCFSEARFELKEDVTRKMIIYAVIGLAVAVTVTVIILKKRKSPPPPP